MKGTGNTGFGTQDTGTAVPAMPVSPLYVDIPNVIVPYGQAHLRNLTAMPVPCTNKYDGVRFPPRLFDKSMFTPDPRVIFRGFAALVALPGNPFRS